MYLRNPDIQELMSKCTDAHQILVSAPFFSKEGLEWVVPDGECDVEFWTRLNPHDWASGVSDPPALIDYLDRIGEERVTLLVHRALHAKIYQIDHTWSWIGSPNLTRAAFTNNIELVAELNESENTNLTGFLVEFRRKLKRISLSRFRDYVEVTRDAIEKIERSPHQNSEDFEAAVALADEVLAPDVEFDRLEDIPSLDLFIAQTEELEGNVPEIIVDHHFNHSNQNRQGHVKQSYYALCQFLLSEFGHQFLDELRDLNLNDYPQLSGEFMQAWIVFLDLNASYSDDDLDYSFSTLRNVLPEKYGGYVTNGGGASGTFTRVAVALAHFIND